MNTTHTLRLLLGLAMIFVPLNVLAMKDAGGAITNNDGESTQYMRIVSPQHDDLVIAYYYPHLSHSSDTEEDNIYTREEAEKEMTKDKLSNFGVRVKMEPLLWGWFGHRFVKPEFDVNDKATIPEEATKRTIARFAFVMVVLLSITGMVALVYRKIYTPTRTSKAI